jgi:hypothetical protein
MRYTTAAAVAISLVATEAKAEWVILRCELDGDAKHVQPLPPVRFNALTKQGQIGTSPVFAADVSDTHVTIHNPRGRMLISRLTGELVVDGEFTLRGRCRDQKF